MGTVKRYADSFRRGDATGQYNAILEIDRLLDALNARSGGSTATFVDDPQTASVSPSQPQAVAFNVSAAGGVFTVQITNPQHVQPASMALARAQATNKPNAPLSAIYHNLQSASDVNFDSTSNFTDYGTSTQTTWNIPNPSVTLYWRVRSSFDGKNFNDFQLFVAPGNSGPTSVSS